MAQAVSRPSIVGRMAAIINSIFFAAPFTAPLSFAAPEREPVRQLSWMVREELTFIIRRAEVLYDQFDRASLTLLEDMVGSTIADPLNDLRLSLAAEIADSDWRRVSEASWEADQCVNAISEMRDADPDNRSDDAQLRIFAACHLEEIISKLQSVLASVH